MSGGTLHTPKSCCTHTTTMDKLDTPLDDVIAMDTGGGSSGDVRGGRPPKGGGSAPGGKVIFF